MALKMQVDEHKRRSTEMKAASRAFPWIVFVLISGLMMSDYMSRQVLSAVFPLLKLEWGLSDSQLASLTSVVALIVGVLALPLSLLADRWGRVRSVVLMAVVWSVATLLSAAATSYGQMFGARLLLGFGEAAYASVGMAVMLSMFAPRLHASLSGAFMASTYFGSVIGVALGGIVADRFGWRSAFVFMAVVGLVLALILRIVVTEGRIDKNRADDPDVAATASSDTARAPLSSLFNNLSLMCVYIGGGLQLFVSGVLLVWLPSFFNRYYDMEASAAGLASSGFVLLIGAGMVLCGIGADRISRDNPARRWLAAVTYPAISLAALFIGFGLDTGPVQLVLIGIGAFFCSGAAGAVTAITASLTHPSIRASAFGVGTLSNNIFGLALGPLVVGFVSDRLGLLGALQWIPFAYVIAIVILLIGRRHYAGGLSKLAEVSLKP
ncbi:multidrug DMT transporter permease [Rhodococcus sp. SRB_17]|nr:multidrug DMT transporter permease [Rhodococcus sp. SRB_17]